jgi:hypothetical protein
VFPDIQKTSHAPRSQEKGGWNLKRTFTLVMTTGLLVMACAAPPVASVINVINRPPA